MLLRREQLNADFRRRGQDEDEEEGEDGEEKPKGEPSKTKPKAKAKGKAKSAPKAKAKGVAKGKAKSVKKIAEPNEAEEAEPSSGSAGDGAAAEPDLSTPPKKRTEETTHDEGSQPKRARTGATWARRYPPQDPVLLVRYQCIKNVFEAEIKPKVDRQSSFQDWFGIGGLVLQWC